MILIYRLALFFYQTALWITAHLKNQKAKLWIEGRKNIWNKIKQAQAFKGKKVWIHVSSLGEFEQGRPIIENIKSKYSNAYIILTFFSPSGYEVRKNYQYADLTSYLPIDNPHNAKKFYDLVQPSIVIFVKYDFWYYYIFEAHKRNIPIFLISALFQPNQIFFTWYGTLFRKMLSFFTHIFVQDKTSQELLKKINILSTIAGDTRCDRVIEISKKPLALNEIKEVIQNRFTIIIGSAWIEDIIILKPIIKKSNFSEICWIIAPHNIENQYVSLIVKELEIQCTKYTELSNNSNFHNVVIINTIGLLSSLYQFANIAYIGGGFGKGIHNTLEPAAFGIPIIFGPRYKKFIEAVDLIKHKAAFSVNNVEEAQKIFDQLIKEESFRKTAGEKALLYIQQKAGATEKILQHLHSYLID